MEGEVDIGEGEMGQQEGYVWKLQRVLGDVGIFSLTRAFFLDAWNAVMSTYLLCFELINITAAGNIILVYMYCFRRIYSQQPVLFS